MFDVGALRATIELAGETLFTAAVKRAESAMRELDSSNAKAATSLSRAEKSTAAAGTAAAKTATSAKGLSTQAAALDKSLEKVNSSSRSASKGLDDAGKSSDSAKKKTQDLSVSLTKMSSEQKQAFTSVGVGAVGMGVALAAGIGVAVAQYVEFDKAMSAVNASIDANGHQMDSLRQKALDLGASTSFSATEAAQGETELAKAGVSVDAILRGGLSGSLSLAAAGQISVADAAETAATALTQFKLSGSDIPHVADLLANGANKAQGGVGDLGQALKQSGLVAAQFGLSIDDTVGTLAAFASNGLIGSDAGTSFKTMLLSLASPSTQAAAAMKQYNIQAYDQQGAFIGTTKLAGVLAKAFKGKSQEERNAALSTIFGTDAIRAANVLYSEGETKIAGWTKAVGTAGGAADTAAKLQNNLSGDLEKLGGSLSTLTISMGSAVDGPGRGLVQFLTKITDAFGNLPKPVQNAAVYLGIGTAALLLLGGTALLAIPKIVEFNAALVTLGTSGIPIVSRGAVLAQGSIVKMTGAMSAGASFLTGPWGLAIAAAAVGVELLGKYLDSLQASSSQMTNSLKTATSAQEIFSTASQGKKAKYWEDVNSQLGDLSKTLPHIGEIQDSVLARFGEGAYFGANTALKEIGKNLGDLAGTDLPAAQHAFSLLADQTDGSKKQLEILLNSMPDYKNALVEQASAAGISSSEHNLLKLAQEDTATSAKTVADQFNQQAQSAADDSQEIQTLIDNMNALNGTNDTAIQKNADYLTGLASIGSTVKNNTKATGDSIFATSGAATSLDQSTAAGASNASMLADVAQKAQAAAQAQYDLDTKTMSAKDATDKFVGTLTTQRAKFVDAATAAGFSKDAVNRLADAVFKMPSAKEIKILADTAKANAAIDTTRSKLNAIPRNLSVTLGVNTTQTNTIAPYVSAAAKKAAEGGALPKANANGSITHYYAQGGFENHVAQIAAAGTTRVWGEPETGGELYAPLATSKRPRSREILRQGASIFGDHYLTSDELAAVAGQGRSSAVGLAVTGTVDLGDGILGTIRGVVVDELTSQADIAAKGKRK